ncbi:unnamed protein product, partial [marine sediment metagenome]
MLTTHFIINCVEMELKYVHSIRDRTLNSKIINLVIKILHFLYDRYLIIIYRLSEAIIPDLKYSDPKFKNKLITFLTSLCNKFSTDIKNRDKTEAIIDILININKDD